LLFEGGVDKVVKLVAEAIVVGNVIFGIFGMFGKLLFETCLHVLDWSDLTERSNSVFFLPSKCDFQRLFRAFFDTLVVGLLTLVSAWFLYKIAKTR
jgi:hypothetical protein